MEVALALDRERQYIRSCRRDSPLASAEIHYLLDEVSFGELAASHGVLCRYLPTALLPIPASNMTTKHTNIYLQSRERNGSGTANGDALMCLAFLRQSGINQPTILDAWIEMASSSMFSRPAMTPNNKEGVEPIPPPRWSHDYSHGCPVLLVTDGGQCKAVERYGAARGIPMDHILCRKIDPTPRAAAKLNSGSVGTRIPRGCGTGRPRSFELFG